MKWSLVACFLACALTSPSPAYPKPSYSGPPAPPPYASLSSYSGPAEPSAPNSGNEAPGSGSVGAGAPEEEDEETTTEEGSTGGSPGPSYCDTISIESYYMTTCPNTSELIPGIGSTCFSSDYLQMDEYGTLTCSNVRPVMVVYAQAFGGNGSGYYYTNLIFCEPDSDTYWIAVTYWSSIYKFNPQTDKIMCMPGLNFTNTYFRKTQCLGWLNGIKSANCPGNFSALTLYSPKANTGTAIDTDLAEILADGCSDSQSFQGPQAKNFPDSTFSCQFSTVLIQDDNVILLQMVVCEDDGLVGYGLDGSLVSINMTTDTLFCTQDEIPDTEASCPGLTPVSECPTLTNITEYTADGCPIPFFSSELITSDPECLQNYTIKVVTRPLYYPEIYCYKPGTNLTADDAEDNRLFMLVSHQGRYHLTGGFNCEGHSILPQDEAVSSVLLPGSTFTCIDDIAIYYDFLNAQR